MYIEAVYELVLIYTPTAVNIGTDHNVSAVIPLK